MALTAQYSCMQGQSWSDVVMNTYQTMDQYVKFLNDNNLEPNGLPGSGQIVWWDPSIIEDQTTATLINANSIKYATLLGYGNPPQPDPTMAIYQKPMPQLQYTASSPAGESVISLPGIIGGIVTGISKGINPLVNAKFNADTIAGQVNLLGGEILAEGETLFVDYTMPATTG